MYRQGAISKNDKFQIIGFHSSSSLNQFTSSNKGDFKNNASISLINVYRLSKADLLLKLILRYVINVFLASCQVSSL